MKDETATQDNALLIPEIKTVALAFESDESLLAIVATIEKECRQEVLSAETKTGRDRIKSLAYKIARSKTAMDEVGKGLTEEANELIKKINGRRNTVKTRMDALRDEIRKPLTDWEEADDKRKAGIKARMEELFGLRPLPASLADLRALQAATIQIELNEDWQEFIEEATKAKDSFLRHLTAKIAEAERLEAQEAEMARLRQEAAQRAQEAAERAVAEAKAAAEQAAKDAEIAALKAELEAMKQQPLPVPVGLSGSNPDTVIVDDVAAAQPVEKIDTAPAKGPFNPLGIGQRPRREILADEIEEAILGIMAQVRSRSTAASEIATAILNGKIPHVKVEI